MATQVQRRWGIFALAVAMVFLNLISNEILGKKGSLYMVFWGYIAYLAYKGDVDSIFQWVKWVLIINVVVGLGFSLFADDDMMGLVGFGSVEEFLIGLGIPVAIKGGLLLYLKGQRASFKTNSDSNTIDSRPTSQPTERSVGAVSKNTTPKRVEIMESVNVGGTQRQSLAPDRPAHREPTKLRSENIEEEKQPIAVKLSAEDEERAYETAGEEVDNGTYRKGLWTKLWAENDGDERKVKLLYIKTRVEELLADLKKSRERELTIAEEKRQKASAEETYRQELIRESRERELALAEERRQKAIAEEAYRQKLDRLRAEEGQAAAECLHITALLEDSSIRRAIETSYTAALRVRNSTEEKIKLLRLLGGDLQWDASKSKEAGSMVQFAGDTYRFNTLYEFCDWFDDRILKEVGLVLNGR